MKKIAYDENKTISFMAKTNKDKKGNGANIKMSLINYMEMKRDIPNTLNWIITIGITCF